MSYNPEFAVLLLSPFKKRPTLDFIESLITHYTPGQIDENLSLDCLNVLKIFLLMYCFIENINGNISEFLAYL